MCRNSKTFTNCKAENIGYTIECKLCKERKVRRSYEGETARNGYIRGKEHLKGWKNKNKNSVLYRHAQTDHKKEKEMLRLSNENNREIQNQLNPTDRWGNPDKE